MLSLINNKSISKVILIGDIRVGKTSLRRRYFGETFKDNYLITLGTEFSIKKTPEGILQIWDLAGQPSFGNVRKPYYAGAHGAILLFDITNEKTFLNLKIWINELESNNANMVPVVIVGNKIDLLEDNDVKGVSNNKVEKYLKELRNMYRFKFPYIQVSAKENINVDKIFDVLLEEINPNK